MRPETLGERLRARRLALGLTLADVAERSGLSLPYVSNLERGRGNPTVDALRAVTSALDLTLADVLNDAEGIDPLEFLLASAPTSLLAFSKSSRFVDAVKRLAQSQGKTADEMRKHLLLGMASAPRRSTSDPVEDDWKRLLDAYTLILEG